MRIFRCVLTAVLSSLAVSISSAGTVERPGKADGGFQAQSAPGQNDFFQNAQKVNAQLVFIHNTSNAGASLEADEDSLAHGGHANAVASLWYSWSVSERAELLVDTAGSDFSTAIGVYTGTSISNLTKVAAASSTVLRRDAWVRFVAEPNVTYKIAIAGIPPSDAGQLRARFEVNGQPDLAAPLLEVTRPVSGTTVREARVRVEGFVVDPLPNSSGVRAVQYTLSTEADSVIRSAQGTTNFAATVDLLVGENIVTLWAIDNADHTSAWRRVSIMLNSVAATNDLFVHRFVLDPNVTVRADQNLEATKETGEPAHAGNTGGASIWYEFVAERSGVLLLSTLGSSFDTLLGVYMTTNVAPAVPTVGSLVEIGRSDDVPGGGRYSELTVTVEQGNRYFIGVDGFDGQMGVVQLTYRFSPMRVFALTVLPSEGNGTVAPGSGIYPENATVALLARPNAGFEFDYFQTAGGAVRQNPYTVAMRGDTSVRAVFRAKTYDEDFEDGFSFSFEGGNWSVQMDPTNRANHVFGAHGNNAGRSTNSVSLTLRVEEGLGEFDFGVSSETNYDRLEFFVGYIQNGVLSTPTQLGAWSGNARGRHQFALRAGLVRLEWRFLKDAAISDGADFVFIDNVDLPLFSVQPRVNLFGEMLTVQLTGLEGQAVRVETSMDLQSWAPSRTAMPDAEGEVRFSERASGGARFYRFVPVLPQ